MAESKIYMGDVGTIIDIDMGEDISQGTAFTLAVERPDGQTVSWTPQIQDTTFLRYVLQTGNVDIAGIYKIQPKLTLGTWSGRGTVVELKVYPLFG